MKKIISLIISSILILTSLYSISMAVQPDLEPTTGSLKITKYEKGATGKEGQNTPLRGVTFDIYKVAEDETSTTVPTDSAILATKQSKVTGEDGTATFPGLALGRYLVVESAVPENVVERISNFLVDIPQTTNNGTSLNYDVEVFPKNNTAYGTITLTKKGKIGSNEPTDLQGVSFVLQKQDGSNWISYPNATSATRTTNAQGKITVTGLPVGNYRFLETSLGTNAGYVLDNQTAYTFTVSLEADNTTKVEPSSITVTNPKPTLTKVITSITRDSDDNNGVEDKSDLDSASVDKGDVIRYTITTDVPSLIDRMPTYVITEKVDDGLTIDEDSIEITHNYLVKGEDYTIKVEDNVITATLTDTGKTKLKENNATSLDLTYTATTNDNADTTSTGNTTTAKLTYSTIVKKDNTGADNTNTTADTDEVEKTVYTGGLQIEKHANSRTGTVLSGAEFKISDSEANAKAGKYIKDAEGTEILLRTGTDGKASYKGLSFGTYYLVETKAPTYDDNGETKSYNLLNKPVRITVGAGSYTEGDKVNYVINRKPTILPLTGGIGTTVIIAVGICFIVVGVIINKKEKQA